MSSRRDGGPEDESGGGKARWPGCVMLGQGLVGVLHAQSSKKSCPSLRPPGASPHPTMFPHPTPTSGICNQ